MIRRRALPLVLAALFGCGGEGPADTQAGDDGAAGSETSGGETGEGDSTGEGTGQSGTGDPPPEGCVVDAPESSLTDMGPDGSGGFFVPSGRLARSMGPRTPVQGFAYQVLPHPTADVAYVVGHTRGDKTMYVVDINTGEPLQRLEEGEHFFGMVLTSDGSRLYVSGGNDGVVKIYDVGVDGLVTFSADLAIGGSGPFVAGLDLSPDDGTLYAADLLSGNLRLIDIPTLSFERSVNTGIDTGWDVKVDDATGHVWVSGLGGSRVAVYDPGMDATAQVQFPPDEFMAPSGLAIDAVGRRVYVALSGRDSVAAVDLDARAVTLQGTALETEFLEMADPTLPYSNVNAIAVEPGTGRLWVARGTDNAISVLDPADLSFLGSVPTGWYPADLEFSADGQTLYVAEGKAEGADVDDDNPKRISGAMTRIDVASLDLAETTMQVLDGYQRPSDVVLPDCAGHPLGPDRPVKHVVLILKENQKFDPYFGDLDDPRIDRDESLVRHGDVNTPNQHALARQYTIYDSFYSEAQASDSGHLMHTTGHINEYVEKMFYPSLGSDRPVFTTFAADASRSLLQGKNFFTHLLDHGIDIRIYGEIVGTTAQAPGGGTVFQYSDLSYPGGPFQNYGAKDEVRGEYVAQKIRDGELATFTYVMLPNDHGEGSRTGRPTKDSHVADNDAGVGKVVAALSLHPDWEDTVVFVTQDDSQGNQDHVNPARTFLIVAGGKVRNGYVSNMHASFASIHATIEELLGIPPMGRGDASARLLVDAFKSRPNVAPYVARDRIIPEEVNPLRVPGSGVSNLMDFRSPDRTPELPLVDEAVWRWKHGGWSYEEAQAWLHQGLKEEADEIAEERWEDRAEATVFELTVLKLKADGLWRPEWDAIVQRGAPRRTQLDEARSPSP